MVVNNLQENHMFISLDTSLDTAQKGLRNEKIRTLHIKKHTQMRENSGNNCSTAPAMVPSALYSYILVVLKLVMLSAQHVRSLLTVSPLKKGEEKTTSGQIFHITN